MKLQLLLPAVLVSLSTMTAYAAEESKETGKAESITERVILAKYQPEKLTEKTYVIHGPKEQPNPENHGFMNNPTFTITSEGVFVVDPGSSVQVGRELVEEIKEVTDKPVIYVFNSHIHGDHWLGNQAFKEAYPDVKIYAHPQMIKEAKAGEADSWVSLMETMTEGKTKGTEAVIPAHEVSDGQEFKIGDVTVKVHMLDWAHTKTDAMYELVEEKVLITGDTATFERIIRMDDASFRGNISAMERGLTLDIDTVIPGHGPSGDKSRLEAQKKYLSTVYETAAELMDEGMEPFEMKDTIVAKLEEYKNWPGFEEEIGKHISLAVLEAEQAAFE